MKRLLLSTVALTLVATACVSGSEPTTTTSTAGPTTTESSPSESTEGSGTPGFKAIFTGGDCPFVLPEGTDPTCGVVALPEDSGDPTGPTIQLAVAIFPSSNPTPLADPVIRSCNDLAPHIPGTDRAERQTRRRNDRVAADSGGPLDIDRREGDPGSCDRENSERNQALDTAEDVEDVAQKSANAKTN